MRRLQQHFSFLRCMRAPRLTQGFSAGSLFRGYRPQRTGAKRNESIAANPVTEVDFHLGTLRASIALLGRSLESMYGEWAALDQ